MANALRRATVLSAVAAVLMLFTACGTSSGPSAAGGYGADFRTGRGSAAAGVAVSVVASTDVWGDVAKQVAGSVAGGTVQITSIITDPAADPHSYEADTQNLLALSKADVVVENGGGYDDFVDTMLKSADNPSATVLNAVDISGKTPPSVGGLNEHVWYDFPTVREVAGQIAAAFAAADPPDAATFRSNAAAFDQKVTGLEQTEAAINRAHAGDGVAITESVPMYLLQACGLTNRTPEEFSKAIEDGTGVSPTVLQQTEDLFTHHTVRLLAYNEQTSGPETEAVLKAARANSVPVIPVTETLPTSQDYLSWMRGNLSAIRAALG
jgi:zinc/manganese transport system substrate-binding protein